MSLDPLSSSHFHQSPIFSLLDVTWNLHGLLSYYFYITLGSVYVS